MKNSKVIGLAFHAEHVRINYTQEDININLALMRTE